MTFTINFPKSTKLKSDTVIAGVQEGKKLSASAMSLDAQAGGLIAHVLQTHKSFTGKRGQILTLTAPADTSWQRIVLLGLGDVRTGETSSWEVAGGKLMAALKGASASVATLHIDETDGAALPAADIAGHIAFGMKLRDYDFSKYKSAPEKAEDAPVRLQKLEIVTAQSGPAGKGFERLNALADGVCFARDLVNEPPNVLYPESYAKRIQEELTPLGVTVEILDEKKMQKLGFHAHLAVGMGSARPPRVVVMHWNGADIGKSGGKSGGKKAKAPVAFVGKGVTFDTGGISIKPAANLDEMKMDMGGSAAVVGLIRSLAARKAKTHVIGVVGLAENMPSDRAYRPGDIIQSFAGKTIEVLNTDAEGRLVLCDALAYVQKTYNPQLVIDLATLTGAIMVALGYEYAGAFSNRDDIWQKLEAASKATGEKLWRMPLDEAYRDEMKSSIADLKNLGSLGRYGGACSAAGFLEHFINKDQAWVHLDIAGTAWINADKPLTPKHATGFGVRVLERLVADNYEN
jgi:leucyl aminopeptidase